MIKNEQQLRDEFIKLCDGSKKAEVARTLGKSRTYVGDVYNGNRGVSEDVAELLGYKLVTKSIREYHPIKKVRLQS